MIILCLSDGNNLYYPPTLGGLTWNTERKSSPGVCKFSIIPDGVPIQPGMIVQLQEDDKGIFYGFVFTYETSKSGIMNVTAYDQLRYFKNKDTYVYSGTASNFLRLLAKDFHLNIGHVVDTRLVMSRVESDVELFDMINNALDETTLVDGVLYVLYDEYGRLCLKTVDDLKTNILIEETSGEDYKYKVSIDENTYNKIKLTYDNEDAGTKDVYIAQDSSSIHQYGLLQYTENIQNPNTTKVKVNKLLNLYNTPTSSLTLNNVFGDSRVRAGVSVIVPMNNVKDETIYHYMLVETAKHTFDSGYHRMDLKLRGGNINA